MHVLVRYELEDFEQWKAAFDEREPVRQEHGWRGGQVFARSDSDRNVVLLAEWDSAESAEAYFDGSEFRKAMQDAGVRRKPDVTLLEHVANVEPPAPEGADEEKSDGSDPEDDSGAAGSDPEDDSGAADSDAAE